MLQEKLKSRAINALSNPDLIDDEDIRVAVFEAQELSAQKQIAEATMLDIAFYRLKLRMGAQTSESEELLYKEALRVVRDTPSQATQVADGRIRSKTKNRGNAWA